MVRVLATPMALAALLAAHAAAALPSTSSARPTDEEVLRSRAPWAIPMGVAVVVLVLTQIVSRVRWALAEAKSASVPSVLQRNERLERLAETSAQLHPVGARVLTKTRGVAKVLAYDESARTYEVAIEGSESATLDEADIEVPEVAEFVVYPIKSCAGTRLDTAEITAKGVRHDRLWMFADEDGKFISQRRYAKMALIAPKLVPSMESPTAIVLTAPGMDDLEVPILDETHGAAANATVWSSQVVAVDQGDKAAAWINAYLADVRVERQFRFLRVSDSFKRATDPKYAPNYETGFADGFPFLVTLEASLAELNASLDNPVLMNRFRPNIVLKGAPAFADEHWNCFLIGGLVFRNVKPCSRCNLPCVDPATGISDPNREPSKTLTRTRNGELLGFIGGKKFECYFGSNVVAERVGTLTAGDCVKVLTLKKEIVA
ncbi:hypothetical protein PybrP1_004120 [[Pythium] brassicae (nom. inval.)]|nr:hypothetical protein PybrP1_004120 [[Pythium] brassicae (nom. inval.)]